jgi:hypothetical protein
LTISSAPSRLDILGRYRLSQQDLAPLHKTIMLSFASPLPSLRAEGSPPSVSSLQRRVRDFQIVLAGVAVLWIAGEVAACFGIGVSPTWVTAVNMRDDAGAMVSLACAFLFFLCARPSRREFFVLGGIAFLVTGALRLLSAWTSQPIRLVHDVGCGVGLASLLLLGRRTWISTGAERTRMLALLLPAILVFLFIPLTGDFHRIGIQVNPTTVDHLMYAADASLGVQLSFEAARLFETFPLLAELSRFVYNTLPFPFVVVLLFQWHSRRPATGSIFWDFQVLAVLGFVVYLLYPAVGPYPSFAPDYFPNHPPDATAVLETWPADSDRWGGGWEEFARNCVPSLHTAWALMLWWHAWSLAWWVRGLTSYYLFFTILATLGFGAHYLFDLILAVPFTLAVRAAGRPSLPGANQSRWGALLFGAGITTGLLLLIRFGLPLLAWSVPLTRVAVLVPLVVCFLWERKLETLYQDMVAEPERPAAVNVAMPPAPECLQTVPLTVE